MLVVSVGGATSDSIDIGVVVPQRSVLGPMIVIDTFMGSQNDLTLSVAMLL